MWTAFVIRTLTLALTISSSESSKLDDQKQSRRSLSHASVTSAESIELPPPVLVDCSDMGLNYAGFTLAQRCLVIL